MTSGETGDGPSAISAEAYPAPTLEYVVSDGVPAIVEIDEAFRSEFGPVSPETPLKVGLEQFGFEPGERFVTRICAGTAFRTQVDAGTPSPEDQNGYIVTVIPAHDGDRGHIVFPEGPGSTTDGQHELGLEHVASVVSHDLRNPLEVAKTRLRAGRETGNDEHFEHVASAHERMERIIEDVLTLARGEDTIDPSEEVALTTVAKTAWDSVDTDGATLSVDSPLPTAVVDPDRTTRVFENLFRNSVEHGSASSRSRAEGGTEPGMTNSGDDSVAADVGSPEIRIGAVDSDEVDGFYVADDGPGIPADERDAVFEPGYSTHEHGTGLGLAIVEQIADAHGWNLRITSSGEDGARIEVRGT